MSASPVYHAHGATYTTAIRLVGRGWEYVIYEDGDILTSGKRWTRAEAEASLARMLAFTLKE